MKTTYPPQRLPFNDWAIYVSNECNKARRNDLLRSKLKARLSTVQAKIEHFDKRGNYLKSEYYQLLSEENELKKMLRK